MAPANVEVKNDNKGKNHSKKVLFSSFSKALILILIVSTQKVHKAKDKDKKKMYDSSILLELLFLTL